MPALSVNASPTPHMPHRQLGLGRTGRPNARHVCVRFHVGAHYVCHTTNLCRRPKLVHRRFLLAKTFSESLDCQFRSDLGPKLEAVGDGLGWSVNPNVAAFDGILGNTKIKGLT